MSVILPRATRPRLPILFMSGATVLAFAACSTSNDHNATQPSPPASRPSAAKPLPPPPLPPPPPVGKDHIEGLVRSVSGNAVTLTQRDRSTATVDFALSAATLALKQLGLTRDDVTIKEVSPSLRAMAAKKKLKWMYA